MPGFQNEKFGYREFHFWGYIRRLIAILLVPLAWLVANIAPHLYGE